MALKEKALRRLSEKLSASNIPFALGGDWMRCQRGLLAQYHAFDVVVPLAEAAHADKVLSRLGMRQQQPTPDGFFVCHYHFDGADVTLWSGNSFPVTTDGEVTVLGVCVPLLDAAAWDAIAAQLKTLQENSAN